MTGYSIGVDLGGTNLRAAAIDASGKILEKIAGSTNFSEGRDAVMSDIVAAMSALRARHGTAQLTGIGIGVPGFIQFKEGIVRSANNLPFLENFAMRDALEHQLNSIVILENDANAAALGEKWMGAGRDTDDLVLLTLGTGIGGGIISGGRILRGYLGMAGELGHVMVVPNGLPCGCGSQGCVEKYSSATALSAMARLLQLGHDLSAKDVYDIAQGADQRAAKAHEIFRVMGESLGMLLSMLINTFNFPMYLLSGGMLPAWDLFAPHMLKTVLQRSYTYRNTEKTTQIAKATLGNEAGLYGAAYLPWVEPRTAAH
ncbi:MAG TPA: ROK family protein [Bryobacteraceae bacterium]|jgi:glucokinase|nr:ROK family protein [Bryobacteraceae bacterium]